MTHATTSRPPPRPWRMAPLAWVMMLGMAGAGCGDGLNDETADMGSGGTGGSTVLDGAGGNGPEGFGGGATPAGFDAGSVNYFADPSRSFEDSLGAVADPRTAPDAYAQLVASCLSVPDTNVCTEAVCDGVAACCIANGNCCTEVALSPIPPVADGGLVPNQDLSEDNGALVGTAVDLGTHRVDLTVRYTAPLGCAGGCVESIGAGFVDANANITGTVSPEVAIVFAPALGRANLVVNDSVVDFTDLGDGSGDWGLAVSPTGDVELSRDGVTEASADLDVARVRNARLITYGRSVGATQAGSLSSVTATVSLCDVPTSWEERLPVRLASSQIVVGNAPSAAKGDQGTRVIWQDGDTFRWASRSSQGSELLALDGAVVFAPAHAYEAGGVADPEIVWDGATWHLFYTAVDASGTKAIGHATYAPNASPLFVSDAEPVLIDAAVSLSAPGVYQRDGLWIVAAHASGQGTDSMIRVFATSALGTGWESIGSPDLGRLTTSTAANEAVNDPSIIVHNGAYQMYVSRRVGARWHIETLASDDLVFWRSLGEVLGVDGSVNTFDALGARAPGALDDGNQIQLYYEGQDGISDRLGFAVRSANAATVF